MMMMVMIIKWDSCGSKKDHDSWIVQEMHAANGYFIDLKLYTINTFLIATQQLSIVSFLSSCPSFSIDI